MSLVYFPGRAVEDFFTDPRMEVQPTGTREHGVPSRVRDGRVYLCDKRPGSPWAGRHNDKGRWVCGYALPTDALKEFGVFGSLEVIPWLPTESFPKGATLLLARPDGAMAYISQYFVALEVPDYDGHRHGEAVLVRLWGGDYMPGEIVGMVVGGRRPVYRVKLEVKGETKYHDLNPEDIKRPT